MQINSSEQVSRIYQMNSASSALTTNPRAVSKNESTSDQVTLSEAGMNAQRKLQEIANNYDPTNMSYSELCNMASDLHQNGLITSGEALAMSAPPSIDFDPNAKYDTVAAARKSVEFDQSLGGAQNESAKLRAGVLDILERLQRLSGNTLAELKRYG